MSWSFEWKNTRGYRYLCLVQKRRTPKGPRNVRQIYLGTPDTVYARIYGGRTPLRSFPYGTGAALLHAAERVGLLSALERHLSADARSLSVPRLLFLQIAGRLEHPLSREGMAQWFSSSALPFLWNVEEGPSARTLRRHLQDLFGVERPDGTILLTRKRVHAIEGEIFRTLIDQGISPKWLLYDGTNFFTFHRSDRWFQRGHSKEWPSSCAFDPAPSLAHEGYKLPLLPGLSLLSGPFHVGA